MKSRRSHNWFILFFVLFTSTACAPDFRFADLFRGNTRKTIVDFDLEDKSRYRNYMHGQRLEKRQKQTDLINYLDKQSPQQPKQVKTQTLPASVTPHRPPKKRTLWQKIFKLDP